MSRNRSKKQKNLESTPKKGATIIMNPRKRRNARSKLKNENVPSYYNQPPTRKSFIANYGKDARKRKPPSKRRIVMDDMGLFRKKKPLPQPILTNTPQRHQFSKRRNPLPPNPSDGSVSAPINFGRAFRRQITSPDLLQKNKEKKMDEPNIFQTRSIPINLMQQQIKNEVPPSPKRKINMDMEYTAGNYGNKSLLDAVPTLSDIFNNDLDQSLERLDDLSPVNSPKQKARGKVSFPSYVDISTLKIQILRQIFLFLEKKDLFNVSLVCKRFQYSSKNLIQQKRKFSSGSFFGGSVILSKENQKKLNDLYGGEAVWSLVYKASRDGWKAKDFHRNCDKKTKTMIIILTDNGSIFGGYNPLAWNSTEIFIGNDDTFLFSLVTPRGDPPKKMKCNGPFYNKNNSVWCSEDYGPCFGEIDIVVNDDAHKRNDNYTHLGYCFRLEGYKLGSKEIKEYFTGSYHFTPKDIEIFQRI